MTIESKEYPFSSYNFQKRVAGKLPTVETSPNGYHIHLPNGYKVSVQWGAGTYSDYHDLILRGHYEDWEFKKLNSKTAEVAVIDPHGELMETPWSGGDTIMGWQYANDVKKIIEWALTLGGKECPYCGAVHDNGINECKKCGAPQGGKK